MTITRKKIERLTSVEELLDAAEIIRKEHKHAFYDNCLAAISQEIEFHGLLETMTYEMAVKNATTKEELEKCAVEIEENSVFHPNPEEWAEHIRIKAYGIEWYLKKQLSSNDNQDFNDFLKETDLENPFDQLKLS